MGLNVCLYRYPRPIEEVEKLENEYEEKSEVFWDEIKAGRKYEELSEEEKKQTREKSAALAKEMGLSEYGEVDGKTGIENPSLKYPKHLCKIGYLRSSYNSGGFNNVCGNLIGMDLYAVFNPNDRYAFQLSAEEWKATRKRAVELLKRLKGVHPLRCMKVGLNPFKPGHGVKSPEEAMETMVTEIDKEKGFPEYSNIDGHFFLGEKGLEICGALPGFSSFGKAPCVYLVYKTDLSWYIQMAEIVVEFCEFGQKNPDVVIHWSS